MSPSCCAAARRSPAARSPPCRRTTWSRSSPARNRETPVSDRVVVIGSVNVDRTVTVARFPRPGETLLASSLSTGVGGKGANQAVAAAKSGASVAMVACLGPDAEGDIAFRALADAGIDTSGVRRMTDTPTGSAWITVASGDNTILVVPGANHRWSEQLPPLTPTDVVLCQLELPMAVVHAATSAASGMV